MDSLLNDEVNLKEPTVGLPFSRLSEGVRLTILSCLCFGAPGSVPTWLVDLGCES